MKDDQIVAILDAALVNCSDDGLARTISENLDYYNGDLPEPPAQNFLSSVVSRDVFDTIESDMPSLVRTFLGPHNVMKFNPTTDNPVDINQAQEKTDYINWIVKNSPNSFKVIMDWMKDGDLNFGVVHYDYVEEEKVRSLTYKGIDLQEQQALLFDLENDSGIQSIDVIEDESNDAREVSFNITQKKRCYKIINIPPENFRVTRGAGCLEDADLVGHEERMTRSDLVQMGYDRELVDSLSDQYIDDKGINDRRFANEGGDQQTVLSNQQDSHMHDPNEEINVQFLYVKLDFDDDGIAERRRIVKVGQTIIDNEPFEIVPYAVLSAIPVPHKLIGYGRAEIAKQHQKIQTRLFRDILNNVYQVNNPGFIGHPEDVVQQDMLVNRPNRFVRLKKRGATITPLVTPYIGDRALQITQYVDAKRSQSLGVQSSSQGLDSDAIHKETATRFQGVKDEQKSKIELVARVYAETGFKQLYEGLAWMVSYYQNDPMEIKVLGKQLNVDPRAWRYDHRVSTTVGLASDDYDTVLTNMGSLLALLERFQEKGYTISDQKKIYNLAKILVEKLGIEDVSTVINDPEQPQQTLMAQNEQLMSMVEQLQAQQQDNPLAEAERIKAQADLVKAQSRSEIEIEKLKLDLMKHTDNMSFKYDELETKENVDIPGRGTNG